MPFWEGKDITSVSLSAQSLIEENPNFLKKAIVQAIQTGADIGNTILASVKNNPAILLNRYYLQAANLHNQYPTCYIEYNFDLSKYYSIFRDILFSEYGNVTIIKATIEKLDPDFYLTYRAEKVFGTLSIDLFNAGNSDYYIYTNFNVPPGIGKRSLYGVIYQGIWLKENTQIILYIMREFKYKWTTYRNGGTLEEWINYNNFFYHVTFKTNDGKIHRWLYDPLTYVYPQLPIYELIENTPKFFPFLQIKKDWAYIDTSIDPYKSSLFIGKIIGIDINKFKTQLQNSGEDSKIYNAWVTHAVDIRSTNPAAIKYMFLFFRKYYQTNNPIGATFNSDGTITNINFNIWKSIRQGIQIIEGSSNFYLFYSHVSHHFTYENIGIRNTYKSNITILPELVLSGPQYEYDYNRHKNILKSRTFRLERSFISLKKQLDSNICEVLNIHGLGFNSVIGGIESEYVKLNSAAELPMLLPLDFNIWKDLDIKDKNAFGYATYQLLIQGYQVTHLKWYETSSFANFLTFIGRFFALVTLGQSLAISELTVTAILSTLATEIGSMAIVTLAVAELTKLAGPEAAIIFSAIAAGYGIVNQQTVLIELPFADFLLAMTQSVFNGIQMGMASISEELAKETQSELDVNKQRLDELKKQSESLYKKEDNPLYGLHLLTKKALIFTNETPEQFYNRTIHNTNPGVDSLSFISSCIGNYLKLPKPEIV